MSFSLVRALERETNALRRRRRFVSFEAPTQLPNFNVVFLASETARVREKCRRRRNRTAGKRNHTGGMHPPCTCTMASWICHTQCRSMEVPTKLWANHTANPECVVVDCYSIQGANDAIRGWQHRQEGTGIGFLGTSE